MFPSQKKYFDVCGENRNTILNFLFIFRILFFLFFLSYLLSFKISFFKENFSKAAILQRILALVLIVFGLLVLALVK